MNWKNEDSVYLICSLSKQFLDSNNIDFSLLVEPLMKIINYLDLLVIGPNSFSTFGHNFYFY